MKNVFGNDYVILISRIIVGMLFIVVGTGKIADPNLFTKEIANYRIFPELLVHWTAIAIPWIEVVCGLMLTAGIRLRANALIVAAMLVAFNFMVASAWIRGLDINCGCYSNIAKQTVGLPKILENTAFFVLALLIFLSPNSRFTMEKFAND